MIIVKACLIVEFFSTINSEKTLRLVIDTIFEVALEATKKSKAIESFQSKDGVYAKIWELYKHSEEKRSNNFGGRIVTLAAKTNNIII